MSQSSKQPRRLAAGCEHLKVRELVSASAILPVLVARLPGRTELRVRVAGDQGDRGTVKPFAG
jgi:hypothetical protein